MASDTLRLTVWGSRGTLPCPGAAYARSGDTACVEIALGARRVILDAGSGLRRLAETLDTADMTPIDIFLSHAHVDHLIGLTVFPPFFGGRRPVRLHGFGMNPEGVAGRVGSLFASPLFPVPLADLGANVAFHDHPAEGAVDLGDGIVLRSGPLNHPDGCSGFRIEAGGSAIAYLTDCELGDPRGDAVARKLAKQADALIVDAAFTDEEWAQRRNWGHSSWSSAIRLGLESQARKIVLFHHDPGRTDAEIDAMEQQAREIHGCVIAARDGLVLEFATP